MSLTTCSVHFVNRVHYNCSTSSSHFNGKRMCAQRQQGPRHSFVVYVTNTSRVWETPVAHPTQPAGTPGGPLDTMRKTPVNLCSAVVFFKIRIFAVLPAHCKVAASCLMSLLHLSNVRGQKNKQKKNRAEGGVWSWLSKQRHVLVQKYNTIQIKSAMHAVMIFLCKTISVKQCSVVSIWSIVIVVASPWDKITTEGE